MSLTVCLGANCIYYPKGGGHLWVYLNWALGLRALGCRVVWLETLDLQRPLERQRSYLTALKDQLTPFGLAQSLALTSWTGDVIPRELMRDCLDLEAASEADLLLNQCYRLPAEVVQRFRRSALLDIDPGLTQTWISLGNIVTAHHDAYFTIGETIGEPGSKIPNVGIAWQYTPPCVALDYWSPSPAAENGPFSTVSHWYGGEWAAEAGELYVNDKRVGYQPFLDLPQRTDWPLELALCLGEDDADMGVRVDLLQRGWRIQDAWEVAATPGDYQRYIRESYGEFSCAKPSYVRLQTAWISDRTLCYLASGKPAVVQHTGRSRFLPDREGLFRFRNIEEAALCLDLAGSDYERQCRLARLLAEEYFDARKVVARVLERALV